MTRRKGSWLTLSRMLEVLATLQMREMMETLWVQETLAKSPKADISDWISSSIKSRSQILLHSITFDQALVTAVRPRWCAVMGRYLQRLTNALQLQNMCHCICVQRLVWQVAALLCSTGEVMIRHSYARSLPLVQGKRHRNLRRCHNIHTDLIVSEYIKDLRQMQRALSDFTLRAR